MVIHHLSLYEVAVNSACRCSWEGVGLGHAVMATRHPSCCSGGCPASYLLGVIIEAVSQVTD